MPALTWHAVLPEVAQAKCEDMIDRDYWAHVDLDGEGINIKMHRVGYALADYLYADPTANAFESLHRHWRTTAASLPEMTTAYLTELRIAGIDSLILDERVLSLRASHPPAGDE